MNGPYSAYVPCCNNATTLHRAVESLRTQTVSPAEIIVIDDGSSDNSGWSVRDQPGVRVVRHETNLGRGAARARAMREAAHELVLCCDATIALERLFVERAQHWFNDPKVAAVFGRLTQPEARSTAERWRGRHLFRIGQPTGPCHRVSLMTGGALVRKTAVTAAGGYASSLRYGEDADLGQRLLGQGFDVISDPNLEMVSFADNTVTQVLERYWRWNAAKGKPASWYEYWKNVGYSIKAMAAMDLRARDPRAALISLVCPHYQFWRTSWQAKREPRNP